MPGDTNYDGVVDLTDLNNVLNNFRRAGDTFPGDTTGDGVVSLDDLNAVRNHFGEGVAAAAPDKGDGGLLSEASFGPFRQKTPVPFFTVRRTSRGHEFIRAWDQALEMDVAAVVLEYLETVATGAATR
jgi:hypothetical protein